jgi:hypothetical protein
MTSIVKILITTAALAAPAAAIAAQPVPAAQCTTSDVRLPTGGSSGHADLGHQQTTGDATSKIGAVDGTGKVSNANGECVRNHYPIDIAAVVQLPQASEEGEQPAELRSACYITCR